MSNQKILTKKLRAIVFTDIANFAKISARDEQVALDLIQKQNDIIKPIVEKHNGEWLKEIGDGLLLSFDSSIESVRCSIEIQKTLKSVDELNIRIGIHQGDIFIKDGDVFGDDVNIASRIESFSPIGGISISDKVHKDISGVSDIKTSFIGHRKLKGIEQETKIRCITSNSLPKFRVKILPRIIGLILIFLGALQIAVLSSVYLGARFNWFEFTGPYSHLSIVLRHLDLPLALIMIGYANFMYVKGISLKVHRYILVLSYILMFLYIFSSITNGYFYK